jgi:hypothetical protein
MRDNVKGLLSKVWKNHIVTLEPGQHHVDEVLTVRLSGTVEKKQDQLIAPTVSLPLITTLALFWEKSGVTKDHALRILKEAITEAITNGVDKDEQIQSRMKDVEKAISTIKQELIAKLPKQKRSGSVVTKNLQVEVLSAEISTPAAA